MGTVPYSSSSAHKPSQLGGSGNTPESQLFGGGFNASTPPFSHVDKGSDRTDNESGDDDKSSSASTESLLTAMTAARITDSPWSDAVPHHTAWYLSTAYEYVDPPSKPKASAPSSEGNENVNSGAEWSSETYEDSLEVDRVFERFSSKVAFEPEQCVR